MAETIKKETNSDFQVKYFLTMLFNKLLFMGTSLNILQRDVEFVWDLDRIGHVDWCKKHNKNVASMLKLLKCNKQTNIPNPTLLLVSILNLFLFLEQQSGLM